MLNNNAYNLSKYMPTYQQAQSYQVKPQYGTQNQHHYVANNNTSSYNTGNAANLIKTLVSMMTQLFSGYSSNSYINNSSNNYSNNNSYANSNSHYGNSYNTGYNQNHSNYGNSYNTPQYHQPSYIAGPRGPVGPAGPRGYNGLDGAPGAIGPMGPVGPVGPRGYNGLPGAIGPMGPVGPVGPRGYNGLPGAIGPMGPVGPVGPVGPRGYNGLDGYNGQDGAQGIQGEKGDKGDKGDPGECCDSKLLGSAYLAGDPQFGLTTPELQAMSGLLQGFDASMDADTTYTILDDSDDSGFKVDVNTIDINGEDPSGISVGSSNITLGDRTVHITSGADAVATITNSDGTTQVVNLADGVSTLDLGNGHFVNVEEVVDGPNGETANRIVVKNNEYSTSFALRDPGNDLPTYLDMGMAELTNDAADNATGHQAQLTGLTNPVTGNALNFGMADLLSLEANNPLLFWLNN